MKTVLFFSIFWTTFFCAYGQHRWQEHQDKVLMKTVYVPLHEGKGTVSVPLKLSKKERQIVAELNQFLLKQHKTPNFPQNGYYNIHHYENSQEGTRNSQVNQQNFQSNSYNLPQTQDNANSGQEISYKSTSQTSVNPQLQYSHPQQIHQQQSFPLDTTAQQNYGYNVEQTIHQGKGYTNAALPPVTQQQQGSSNLHDTTRTSQDYQHSVRQNMAINYPSSNQQNTVEYQNNPPNYSTQSYAAVGAQTAPRQPAQNNYQFEVQRPTPPPIAPPSTITQSHQTSTAPATFHPGQQLQSNLQEQSPPTFQSYQTTLSQQIQHTIPIEQSSQYQYQHSFSQNPQPGIISPPPKNSNMVPVTISQYQTTVHRPIEGTAYTSIDNNVPATNTQTAESYQNAYNPLSRNPETHITTGKYQPNSQQSAQYASTAPHFRQQYHQSNTPPNPQSQMYHDPSSVATQSDPPSQSYHSVPETTQETYNVNPRLVYTQPPSNYLYPENQQQYGTNPNTQNVVVVYKNQPSSYVQPPLNYNQQSNAPKLLNENQQALPKVNFKPVYGYSYN